MFRDFSETAKQQLLQYVEDVTGQSIWQKAKDAIGDCLGVSLGWINRLAIKLFIDNVENYHDTIIETRNTTTQQIEQIFADVKTVDEKYVAIFQQEVEYVKSIKTFINDLANTIDPNGGNMQMEIQSGILEASIREMTDAKATSKQIIAGGMNGISENGAAMSPDPVNLSTGNFVYDMEDLKIEGSIPISCHRYYNSKDNHIGVMGKEFQHNYEIFLKELGDKKIKIRLADGQEVYFEKQMKGYEGLGLALGTLEKINEEFSWKQQTGRKLIFNKDGKIKRQERKNGEGINFLYDEENRLKEACSDTGMHLFYEYDKESGYLIQVTDHTGRKVTFEYENGVLIKAIQGERVYSYHYASNGRIMEVVNACEVSSVKNKYDNQYRVTWQQFPDGSEMSFTYDDSARSVVMTERNGSKTTHIHDEKFRNVETRYEDGSKETYIYNDKNQCVCMTLRGGQTKRMSYDNRGNLIQVINSLRQKINLTYNQYNRLLSVSVNGKNLQKRHYDSKGYLVKTEDYFGHGCEITNDSKGRPITCKYSDGSEIHMEYDSRGNLLCKKNAFGGEIRYKYNDLNQITCIIDEAGFKNYFEYDEYGQVIKEVNALGDSCSYSYNKNNKLVKFINYDGASEEYIYNSLSKPEKVVYGDGKEVSFKYDSMWNMAGITLPNGAHHEYIYNRENRLEEIKNAMGERTQYKYDVSGNCISEISSTGVETKFAYDSLGRLVEIEESEGTKIIYKYDNNDNLIFVDNGKGTTLTLSYDEINRLVKEESNHGECRNYTYTAMNDVESVTDEKGNVKHFKYLLGGEKVSEIKHPNGRIENYSYDIRGNLSEVRDGIGNVYYYKYDPLNRLSVVQDEDGIIREYGYDALGNVILVKDGMQNETHYTYSSEGQILKVEDALGYVVEYEYDVNGQLIKVIQKGEINEDEDRITSYERDILGRICSIKDALGYEEKYSYDALGQLTEKIDKDGYLTRFSYNQHGKLKKVQYDLEKEVEFNYNRFGQLEEIQDWQGKTSFELDSLGRTRKIHYPNGDEIGYTYGNNGERSSLTYPNGETIHYEYDNLLHLTSLSRGSHRVEYNYDNYGRLKEKRYSNGMATQYSYNKKGLLEQILHNDRQGILESYQFSYDQNLKKTGCIKERRDLENESGTYEYCYDALGRIKEVLKDQEVLRAYEYDAFGNRLTRKENGITTNYKYNVLNQIISKVERGNEESYSYDQRGNMNKKYVNGKLKNQYIYGSLNRLEHSVNEQGMSCSYQYNGMGYKVGTSVYNQNQEIMKHISYTLDMTNEYNNLLQKEENGKKTNYLWDGNLLGILGSTESDSMYFMNDDIGSPSRLIGEELLESYGYDEFGNNMYHNQSQYHSFGFTGYQWDEIVGNYFAQARQYMPEIGRFAARDIIKGEQSESLSLNEYAYCRNAPKDYVDLNGKFVISTILIGVAVGAATGFLFEGVTQTIDIARGKEENYNVGKLVGSTVEGAIVGGIGAAVGAAVTAVGAGVNLGTSAVAKVGTKVVTALAKPGGELAATMVAGALGSAAGNAVEQKIEKDKVEGKEVVKEAVVGGIVSGIFWGVGKGVQKAMEKFNINLNPYKKKIDDLDNKIKAEEASYLKTQTTIDNINKNGKKVSPHRQGQLDTADELIEEYQKQKAGYEKKKLLFYDPAVSGMNYAVGISAAEDLLGDGLGYVYDEVEKAKSSMKQCA